MDIDFIHRLILKYKSEDFLYFYTKDKLIAFLNE